MRFHLPRRHRRKLLFPSGLLALAGLLWLGCVALGTWQEKLKPRYIVQLTLPPKPDSDTIYHYTPLSIPFLYSQLYSLYTWHKVEFNGNSAHDSASALSISRSIETMRADTIPNCGIRVQVGQAASYKVLIKLMDLMNSSKQKKYLFDIYHGPIMLYVLVDSYTPQPISSSPLMPICGGTGGYSSISNRQPNAFSYWSAPYFVRFEHWLATLFNPSLANTTLYTAAEGTGEAYDVTLKLERQYLSRMPKEVVTSTKFLLLQSEWRIPLVLIGFMAILNCWRLKRQLQYH